MDHNKDMQSASAASSAIIGTLSAYALSIGAGDTFKGRIEELAETAAQAVLDGTTTVDEIREAVFMGKMSRTQRRAAKSSSGQKGIR